MQFQATVHDRPHLRDIDQLTYLQDALKGGPAMYVIQRLTLTAESYGEAIKCLKNRYDRPRVTHYEHVQSTLQAPIMKANNGRELRKLYDVRKQHIRAIKLSNRFDLEMFLTIAMELTLTGRLEIIHINYWGRST